MANNDTLLALISETRDEVANLRDNHLLHLSEDVARIVTDVEVIKERLKPIERHVEDIQGIIKAYAQKGVLMVVAGATAGVGYVQMG